MRRVVVTGMGIWSCIGQDLQSVTENLRLGRSGIIRNPERESIGFQCLLHGNLPEPDLSPFVPRKFRKRMSQDAQYAYMAVKEAFAGACISENYLSQNEVGIIFGNDCNTSVVESAQLLADERDTSMLGPYALFKNSTSSVTMNLSSLFQLRGISLSVASACASSSHAIGLGMILIKDGLQDMIVVGGSCEVTTYQNAPIDALNACSLRNDNPLSASRPFDQEADGMVPSGGAAALVLEEYEHAKARGANILAEICGYGFSSNGQESVSLSSSDAEYIAMKRAIENAGIQPSDIDYVNAHGTSTRYGDKEEAIALTRLLGNHKPWISSTKSITGHENWMAGASEAVYSILMMQNGFVAPNINLANVIDDAKDLKIVRKTVTTPIHTILSSSFGMGGTNSAIILKKI